MQLHMICRLRAHVVEWRVYRERTRTPPEMEEVVPLFRRQRIELSVQGSCGTKYPRNYRKLCIHERSMRRPLTRTRHTTDDTVTD